MLYRKIIVVCFEIHARKNVHCGQNTEFLNVEAGDT
jgi:hypothetical protein